MTTIENIVYQLEVSNRMLHMFVDDLSSKEMHHRLCADSNCAAWIIGHLVLTDRFLLTKLGANPPELSSDFEEKYQNEPSATKRSDYGDTSDLMKQMDAHRTMLIEAVKKLDPKKLDEPLEQPRPVFKTFGEFLTFLSGLHFATHIGQITYIRRSLGRPPLI
ncbi:MAG TPA: DinB family protein [Tepidisphaeraceae bacterium]|nr:DinB family protein [Tepidisphaeraceae bacterium]